MVDLQTENITSIHGLGFKDWSQLRMDPSDKDGGKIHRLLVIDSRASVLFFFVSKTFSSTGNFFFRQKIKRNP